MIDIDQAKTGGAPTAIDALRSIPHLVDSCSFGHKHGMRHLHETRSSLERFQGGDPTAMASVAWNAEHTTRHIGATYEHSDKLIEHINKHGEMLAKVPLQVLKGFSDHATRLSAAARAADKGLKRAFSLMAAAQEQKKPLGELKAVLQATHRHFEDAGVHIRDLHTQVMVHPEIRDEYYRLSAHNTSPDEHLPKELLSSLLFDSVSLGEIERLLKP